MALALALALVPPPSPARLALAGTEITDRAGHLLALRPAADTRLAFPAPVSDVSPLLVRMLVAREDRYFADHPGVNPLAIARALGQWALHGHIVSGASTIAMQAARLLHPRPRTLRAKLIEAFRALQLTLGQGRRRVLDIWLSLAPEGGNLVGVEAASRAWFGHSARVLGPAEAALLVALPRRPEALRPDLHPAAARAARAAVLARAARAGILSQAEAAAAARVPLPRRRHLPAPLAPALLAGIGAPGQVVRTTLDRPLELALTRLAGSEISRLCASCSLAILVADSRARAIRAAYAGDWGNPRRAGYLDLTRAIRSPGSTLKPFLYGLAFAQGIAGPGTWLADTPRRFGFYAPEDFNHRFMGRVRAADALRRSLNLPAVTLLARLGPLPFLAALRATGLPFVLPRFAAPSLPMVLGGLGTSLRALTALYAGLASDGRVAPLRLLAGAPLHPLPLLDPAAARIIRRILTRPFPDRGPAGIGWKTGTSAGNRDSWAFGFDRRHVVGVWVGRPDGTPMPGGVSTSLALPILERVFGLLPAAPRAQRHPASALDLAARPAADPLRLLFPPPGTVIEGAGAVALAAMGGQRPLRFLVDGSPIRSRRALRRTRWTPPGPGFYRITVLDAAGAAADAWVRVRSGADR
ncbi:MAG: transglycosylase domain-containing protein [Acetobacteraceae bacterium]